MADAPWRPVKMVYHYGVDWEGHRRGFSWCGLCGANAELGIVVTPTPADRGTAFFCLDCCKRLGMVAEQLDKPIVTSQEPN
jgi:hypothetical protein